MACQARRSDGRRITQAVQSKRINPTTTKAWSADVISVAFSVERVIAVGLNCRW